MLLGVQKSVREWTLTFPRQLPLWELEPRWTLESLESDCRGQNSLDWKVTYIIENILERRCLKGASPFGHLKHKLWSKKRLGVKLAVWLPTSKSRESTWFPCVQVACHIPSECSRWGLQLCIRLHFNQRFAHKIMRPQSRGNPNFGNFGTPIWESWDKMSFGCGPCEEAQSIL